ncbi:MAG: hypothetical protein ACK559_25070, partial [bacterium]
MKSPYEDEASSSWGEDVDLGALNKVLQAQQQRVAASGDRFPSPALAGQLDLARSICMDRCKMTYDGMRQRAVRTKARTFPAMGRGHLLKPVIHF